MRDRPAHDAGEPGRAGERHRVASAPSPRRKSEQRQQRQAEDGEVVALDPLEELRAQALELIGADRRRARARPIAAR